MVKCRNGGKRGGKSEWKRKRVEGEKEKGKRKLRRVELKIGPENGIKGDYAKKN